MPRTAPAQACSAFLPLKCCVGRLPVKSIHASPWREQANALLLAWQAPTLSMSIIHWRSSS